MTGILCKKCEKPCTQTSNGLCRNCDPELDAQMRHREERDMRRANLYLASRVRVLSADEMKEFLEFGEYICVPLFGGSYNREQIRREFLDLIYQQARLKNLEELGAKEI